MRVYVVMPAAGTLLALSAALALAAGPFDGTWQIEAPRSGATANALDPMGCEPVTLQLQIKDNQISGSLERSRLGRARVESSEGSRATPLTGTVQADGTLNARWENYDVVGKLTGETAEVRWTGPCGQRVATGKRISESTGSSGGAR